MDIVAEANKVFVVAGIVVRIAPQAYPSSQQKDCRFSPYVGLCLDPRRDSHYAPHRISGSPHQTIAADVGGPLATWWQLPPDTSPPEAEIALRQSLAAADSTSSVG